MPIANPHAGHGHADSDMASDNQGSEAETGIVEVDPVCGMTVSSVSVITNALRLRRVDL